MWVKMKSGEGEFQNNEECVREAVGEDTEDENEKHTHIHTCTCAHTPVKSR